MNLFPIEYKIPKAALPTLLLTILLLACEKEDIAPGEPTSDCLGNNPVELGSCADNQGAYDEYFRAVEYVGEYKTGLIGFVDLENTLWTIK